MVDRTSQHIPQVASAMDRFKNLSDTQSGESAAPSQSSCSCSLIEQQTSRSAGISILLSRVATFHLQVGCKQHLCISVSKSCCASALSKTLMIQL